MNFLAYIVYPEKVGGRGGGGAKPVLGQMDKRCESILRFHSAGVCHSQEDGDQGAAARHDVGGHQSRSAAGRASRLADQGAQEAAGCGAPDVRRGDLSSAHGAGGKAGQTQGSRSGQRKCVGLGTGQCKCIGLGTGQCKCVGLGTG